MTSNEAHQTLLRPYEDEELQIKSMQNLNNHLKSSDILKSAVKTTTSNTKFMFFMILSTLPFFVFILFFEMVIFPKVMDSISKFLIQPSWSYTTDYFNGDEYDHDQNDLLRENFRIMLELFPFYFVLLPLLELFSFPVIINVAAKIYAGVIIQSSSTLKQEFSEVFYYRNNIKSTVIWVQLLSLCTLAGLFWTVISHHFIMYQYVFFDGYHIELLSLVIHGVIFLGVLYKYLEWCAIWNMGMVICVLQKETGAYALEMAAFYGKHCKRTGFELMLAWFVYNVVIRVPFLVARVYSYVSVGVYYYVVIAIVVGLVCLGSLVKWVAIVVYFYDCKALVLSKKVDEEVGK